MNVTSIDYSYIGVGLAIALIILNAIDSYQKSKKGNTDVDNTRKRKITIIGILVFLISLAIAINSYLTIGVTTHESKISDSTHTSDQLKLIQADSTTRKNILDSLGAGNRTLTEIRATLDSLNKKKPPKVDEEKPLLDVDPTDSSKNPVVKINGSIPHYVLRIITKSIGNFLISSPDARLYSFFLMNKKISNRNQGERMLNESDKLQKDHEFASYYYFTLDKTLTTQDTILFYWKVSFKNGKGVSQPPLRKLYYFTISNVGDVLNEPNNAEFIELKKRLIKNKIWK